MRHIKSINELFGIFGKKKDDDIVDNLIKKLNLTSEYINIVIDETGEDIGGTNYRGRKYTITYDFIFEELPINLTVVGSWTSGVELQTSSTYYILTIDGVQLETSKNKLKKLKDVIINIKEKPKKEDDKLIKKDIRNILR